MTDNKQRLPTLDHNGQIPLEWRAGDGMAALIIHLAALERPENLGGEGGHFQSALRLRADDVRLNIAPYYDSIHQCLVFGGVPGGAAVLTLYLHDQPVLKCLREDDALRMDAAQAHERLTVDDLRMLATSDIAPGNVPVPRRLLRGFNPRRHAPITDLHTHSSAQLRNVDLMELAVAHDLDYPVELLENIAITLDESEMACIRKSGGFGMRFSPTEHEKPRLLCETQNEPCDVIPLRALTPPHRVRLCDQLQIAQDRTLSFSDFDHAYYRYVNPLVKNPAITKDMIMQIAYDYRRHGVRYAELSTASMLNLTPDGQATWFSEMIRAVRQAEDETGVQLRFLIGVPRSYGPAKIMAELEKIKYAARHPFVSGVDLLGYESNRTSDFSAALSHIADWARMPEGSELKPEDGWDFRRDFMIRIHAGETGKNSGNVAEAVKIAERFAVPVRVAHAVNEKIDPRLDRKIKKLSARIPPLLSMEFCPSSNLAYNNIQNLRAVPFRRWLNCCAVWFLGSDGAGAIQTTPVQLALAALAGGCTLRQLTRMRRNEEAFIADARQRFAAKMAAYRKLYAADGQDADTAFLAGLAAHVQQVNRLIDPATLDSIHPQLPVRFAGRMPILIAGASGDSFKEINRRMQRIIRQAMRMLVDRTDPQRAYFVVGRSKSEGVTAALDDAIMAHNRKHPGNKFAVLALITEDTPDLPRSISWVVPQEGTRDKVPDNIIRFMRGHTGENLISGVSIFIGGSNYTSDMILKCRQGNGLAYLLMENAAGASRAHAMKAGAQYRFRDGRSLLQRISGLFEGDGALSRKISPLRARLR